jgi:hypothetical protein
VSIVVLKSGTPAGLVAGAAAGLTKAIYFVVPLLIMAIVLTRISISRCRSIGWPSLLAWLFIPGPIALVHVAAFFILGNATGASGGFALALVLWLAQGIALAITAIFILCLLFWPDRKEGVE